MAEATLKLGLDLSEINATLNAVEARLKRAAEAASNVGRNGGGQSATQRAEQEALRYAQAQARLQATTGNLTGAQTTLQHALAQTNQESIAAIRAQTQLEQVNQRAAAGWRRHAGTIREAGESLQNAGYAFSAVSGRILDLGRAAVQSAVDIDRQVNVLKALTGSASAAEARFKALFALSQRTPGLTTNLALTLDAQLRTAQVTAQTIDRILPAIGRLNAVSPLGDPQKFAQNLVQLVTQNFERTDLKELVGQSPIAGQIIQELFDVDSPTNAKAIRESPQRLAIRTVDDFFRAFAEAAEKNKGLANVTESLGTQFDKLRDRALVALRPLGLEIINTLGPLIEKAVPLIEQLSTAFASLPQQTREAVVVIGLLAAALGPLTIALGAATQAVGAFGNLAGVIGGAAGLGGAGAAVGTFTLILAGAAVEAAALKDAYQTNFGDLRDIVQGFVAEAQLFWANYGDEIKAGTQAVWGFIKTYIVDTVTGVLDTVRGVLALLNGNWETGLRSLLSGAQRILASLVPNFVKAGQDIVKGLVEGIVSGKVLVVATLKEIAASAITTMRLALRTQSPSVEFFEIGEQTIEGFILGAHSKAQQSAAEIREITRAIIAAAAPPDTIANLRAQEALRRENAYLFSFIPTPGPSAIPGGDIPTPQALRDAAEALRDIPPPPPIAAELSNAARFAKGFAAEIESAGDIFERFGRNVSGSFRNVTDLFKNLGSAFKNLFLDLIGNGLQRIVTGGLNSLFSALGGGARGSSGGLSGFFGSIFGGNGGSLFRTPGFNPSAGGGSSFLSQVAGLNFGISVPPSITGAPGAVGTATRTASSAVNAAQAGLFGGLFNGIGFGRTPGSGGALASLLPFLGVSLGASLGGGSGLGGIIGGIGGGLLGVGLTAAPAIFGAGGALASPAIAALFSNPFTAIAGGVALAAAFFIGRRNQRRKDEATSGDYLQQAVNAIKDLKAAADAGQLTSVAAARNTFENQILKTFIEQINTIKTRSVRESRLTNQTRDLRKLFEDTVIPAVIAANTRKGVFDKLIPEFATGGVIPRTGLVFAHANEIILNQRQQQEVLVRAGRDVFRAAGVPNAPAPTVYASNGGGGQSGPLSINLSVQVGMSQSGAQEIFITGAETSTGERVIVNLVNENTRNGEIK